MPRMTRRRPMFLSLSLGLILLLGSLAVWGLMRSQAVWGWGGRQLLRLAQAHLEGDLKVREVRGHPLTGLTFLDLTLSTPQGEVFQVPRLELRFSPWSFVKLQPVIGRLVMDKPRLTLRQDQAGRWQGPQWRPPTREPGADPRTPRPGPALPFRSLDLKQMEVAGGEIILIRPGETQHYRNLNLDLALTVLHPRQPQQSVLVRRAALAGDTPWGRFGLETRLTYSHQRLNLISLELQAREHRLAAVSGEVRLGEGEPNAALSLELGPLSGETLQSLFPRWPESWDLAGKFQLTGSPAGLQVTGAGRWQQVAYTLNGLLSRLTGPWTYDLDLQVDGLKPDLLTALNRGWAEKFKGLPALNARLELEGAGFSWPPPELEYRLTLAPWRYGAAHLEQLELTLAGDHRTQSLTGVMRGNFGRLTLAAEGPLLTSPQGTLKIQADSFQPGLLGLSGFPESLLTGKFTGDFRLPAASDFARVRVAGDLEAQGRFRGQPLPELRARLAWEQPKLEVSQARMHLGGLTADLKGVLDGDRLDWQFRAGLSADAAAPFLPSGLRGHLTGDGTLQGTLKDPQFACRGEGQGLAGAGLTSKSASFKANGRGWPPAAGNLEITGTGFTAPGAALARMRFTARGENHQWRLHFQGATPQGPQAEVLGAANLAQPPWSIRLDKISWQSPTLQMANVKPVQVRLYPGLELAPAAFRINEGQLTIQGQVGRDQVTGRLELKDLPAELFQPRGFPLQGKLRAWAALSGAPAAPALQGELAWGPGRMGAFSFKSLQTNFNYRDHRLAFAGGLEEKTAGPRLTWEGKLPLRLSLSPRQWAWGDQDLLVRVQGEKVNLALLTALTREVTAAAGSLDLRAEWQGPPRSPRLSGDLRWGPGFLTFRQAGLPYRLKPGQAHLKGQSLTFPEIVLESEGTARIAGAVTFAGFQPRQVEARAQLDNFLTLKRTGSRAVGQGVVTLKGPWSAPLFSGHLLVPQAVFSTAFFQTGRHDDIVIAKKCPPPGPGTPDTPPSPAPPVAGPNLYMDLSLEAPPQGVWVKNKNLQIELAGRLKITKQPGGPTVVGGTLQAVKGNIDLHGRSFKVERGTVRMPGKPREPATVEGRALSQLNEITLIMNISGPANKPQVALESIPPLPPPDLLAYMVFGRPAQSLTREEYLSVGQQAAGILGGLTAKKIQEFLGKDFPLVGDVTMKGGKETVGVSKPLTKDLSVSFERKMNPISREDTNQVKLEYKVNKYLSVESQMGRRNTGGDVMLNLDF